jgi:aromatic ring-cleaving dioxygenase
MDERSDTLLQSLLGMRGENRNAIIEGTCRLFAECEKEVRDAEIDERKKDEAVQMCRMMIRGRMMEQIEVEESAGNEDTAAHLRIVLGIFIANCVGDRPAHATPPKPPEIAASPADPRMITHYHAHIYYDPALTRDCAALARERVAAAFPAATLGRWHDAPVGPHPQSMYQIAFPAELLASFVPWLMLNRDGLTILLHPETGNDYADHTEHAVWFGAILPLRLDVLRGYQTASAAT